MLRSCENENFYLVIVCDSSAQHTVWDSTNCKSKVISRSAGCHLDDRQQTKDAPA
jgi:hypothetical protein